MVVAVLREICKNPDAYRGVSFASLATDGNDGPTDSAGGWISSRVASRAAIDTQLIDDALSRSDAYPLLDRLDCHLRTGPTNTNVCDIQVLLVS